MRYDRLTILLARVIADQDDYGYCTGLNVVSHTLFSDHCRQWTMLNTNVLCSSSAISPWPTMVHYNPNRLASFELIVSTVSIERMLYKACSPRESWRNNCNITIFFSIEKASILTNNWAIYSRTVRSIPEYCHPTELSTILLSSLGW